jgi:hypothetical protein
VARCLIEHEECWVPDHCPSDGDPLALSTREPHTALSDLCLVAVRELGNELVGTGVGRGGDDVLVVAMESPY